MRIEAWRKLVQLTARDWTSDRVNTSHLAEVIMYLQEELCDRLDSDIDRPTVLREDIKQALYDMIQDSQGIADALRADDAERERVEAELDADELAADEAVRSGVYYPTDAYLNGDAPSSISKEPKRYVPRR